jgi:hypothetical protein
MLSSPNSGAWIRVPFAVIPAMLPNRSHQINAASSTRIIVPDCIRPVKTNTDNSDQLDVVSTQLRIEAQQLTPKNV